MGKKKEEMQAIHNDLVKLEALCNPPGATPEWILAGDVHKSKKTGDWHVRITFNTFQGPIPCCFNRREASAFRVGAMTANHEYRDLIQGNPIFDGVREEGSQDPMIDFLQSALGLKVVRIR